MAWDTDDILSQISINHALKLKEIDWKWALKNVFKLQKLIYRASSFGKIRNIIKYQRFMTSSDYALLLTVRRVSQDH